LTRWYLILPKILPFEFTNEERKIDMKGWFASSQADPIDPLLQGMEPFQDMTQWNREVLLRMKKEGSIMTIRAAEVAPREKENRADLSRPVDERSLQETFDLNPHH